MISHNLDVLVRPFEQADGEAVRDLFIRVNRQLAPPDMRAAFEDYISRSIETEIGRIKPYYAERRGGFWVAVADGAVIGMFGCEAIGEAEFELRRMYVDPALRRRGIARSMLAFAEAEVRQRGRRRLVLSTSELQKDALSLYRSTRYREVRAEIAEAPTHKTVGGGIRRFHFSKDLTEAG